jgi:hypothetical protein
MENEIYKAIDGYSNYEVSNLGNVRNTNTGRILKPQIHKNGYHQVNLSKKGKLKSKKVHKLVANAFLKKVDGKIYVDHINNDKRDNRSENLRFCSSSENSKNRSISTRNTSGAKGVSFYKRYNKWESYLMNSGKRIHIGYFSTKEEAIASRQRVANELFGEFIHSSEKIIINIQNLNIN